MDEITLTELRKPHPCDGCKYRDLCEHSSLACKAYAYHITTKGEFMPHTGLSRIPCMPLAKAEREQTQGELIL